MLKIARGSYIFVFAAAGVLLPVLLAYAGWKEDLAAEIRTAHGCQVKELAKSVEREAKGLWFVVTTVHCTDGRTFTAGRIENQPFIFDQCGAPGKSPCP